MEDTIHSSVGRVRMLHGNPSPTVVGNLPPTVVLKEGNPFADPPITFLAGPISRRLNALSKDLLPTERFIQGLEFVRQKEITLVDVFYAYGIVESQAEAKHFQDDWFNNTTGWWPGQDVEQKMTAGLLEAFRTARDTHLPVQYYWVIYYPYPDEKLNQVFTRVSHPRADEEGSYSILFTLCTPAIPAWIEAASGM